MSRELTEANPASAAGSTADPAAPIALAFAAAAESWQPSEADRAILTAFATVKDHVRCRARCRRDADRRGDASFRRGRAAAAASLALVHTGRRIPPAADSQAVAAAPAAPASEGVVIGPPEPVSYQSDEPELVDLIQPAEAAAPNTRDGQFAMPTPEAGFLLAPQAGIGSGRSPWTVRTAGGAVRARLGGPAGKELLHPALRQPDRIDSPYAILGSGEAEPICLPALSTDLPPHCYQAGAVGIRRPSLSSGRYSTGAGRTLPTARAALLRSNLALSRNLLEQTPARPSLSRASL